MADPVQAAAREQNAIDAKSKNGSSTVSGDTSMGSSTAPSGNNRVPLLGQSGAPPESSFLARYGAFVLLLALCVTAGGMAVAYGAQEQPRSDGWMGGFLAVFLATLAAACLLVWKYARGAAPTGWGLFLAEALPLAMCLSVTTMALATHDGAERPDDGAYVGVGVAALVVGVGAGGAAIWRRAR